MTALAARLSRVLRIYLDYCNTSFFRFVLQLRQEGTPANVVHRLGKTGSGETLHVQILASDQAVGVHQFTRQLVVKVKSLVRNVLVDLRNSTLGFLPAITSPLASGKIALRPSQLRLRVTIKVRRVNAIAIRSNKEGLQSQVNSNRREGRRFGFRVRQFAHEDDVPLVDLTFEGYGLDLPLDRTMEFDLHIPDVLEIHFVAFQLTAVAIGSEFHCIKTISTLEARVSRLLAVLDSAEECLEGLV